MDSPVSNWLDAVLFRNVITTFLARERLASDDHGRRRCRRRGRRWTRRRRAGLCRRVVQGCWVRRDAPLPGRTREGVRRRVEVRDRKVAEVEANRGQVRLLEGHKVRVVEVPAVDVRRVERTGRDGTHRGCTLGCCTT